MHDLLLGLHYVAVRIYWIRRRTTIEEHHQIGMHDEVVFG